MSRKYRIRHETALQVRRGRRALASPAAPGAAARAVPGMPGARDRGRRRKAIGAWIEVDAFGNPMIRIELAQPHRELKVISQMQIEVHPRPAVSPRDHAGLGKGTRFVRLSRRVAVARPARRRALPPRVAARAAEAELSPTIRRTVFRQGEPILACAEALQHEAAQGHRVRARRHHHRHVAHRGARNAPRRLPGLRAPHDLLPAFARPAGALRERLPAHQCHGGRQATRSSSAMRRHMPGCRCGVRRTAGSSSIRPTAASPAPITSRWPGAGTSAMYRRCAA